MSAFSWASRPGCSRASTQTASTPSPGARESARASGRSAIEHGDGGGNPAGNGGAGEGLEVGAAARGQHADPEALALAHV